MTNIIQLDRDELEAVVRNCVFKAVSEIKENQKTEIKPDRIDISEVEKMTGLKKSTLYKMTMNGEIEFEKFGKRLIFSRKKIQAFIDQNTIRNITASEKAYTQLSKVANKS